MSDRDTKKVADDAAASADAAPPVAENGAGTKPPSATKPKRTRSAKPKPTEAPESAHQEAAEMVAEGGPVGDEEDRELGVDSLPAETVERETAEIEKAHPELVGKPPTAESDAAKAAVTAGDAVVGVVRPGVPP